jgi:hypothetical protein
MQVLDRIRNEHDFNVLTPACSQRLRAFLKKRPNSSHQRFQMFGHATVELASKRQIGLEICFDTCNRQFGNVNLRGLEKIANGTPSGFITGIAVEQMMGM